jgi:hypothetical protein
MSCARDGGERVQPRGEGGPRFPEDDIFALARAYNETFLPLKNRQDGGAGQGALSLDQDAMRDLFTGEAYGRFMMQL